jgi:hypothetical protein
MNCYFDLGWLSIEIAKKPEIFWGVGPQHPEFAQSGVWQGLPGGVSQAIRNIWRLESVIPIR